MLSETVNTLRDLPSPPKKKKKSCEMKRFYKFLLLPLCIKLITNVIIPQLFFNLSHRIMHKVQCVHNFYTLHFLSLIQSKLEQSLAYQWHTARLLLKY